MRGGGLPYGCFAAYGVPGFVLRGFDPYGFFLREFVPYGVFGAGRGGAYGVVLGHRSWTAAWSAVPDGLAEAAEAGGGGLGVGRTGSGSAWLREVGAAAFGVARVRPAALGEAAGRGSARRSMSFGGVSVTVACRGDSWVGTGSGSRSSGARAAAYDAWGRGSASGRSSSDGVAAAGLTWGSVAAGAAGTGAEGRLGCPGG